MNASERDEETRRMIEKIGKGLDQIKEGQTKLGLRQNQLEKKQDEQLLRLHELNISISGSEKHGLKGLAQRQEDSEKETKRVIADSNEELGEIRTDVAQIKGNLKIFAAVVAILAPVMVWIAELIKGLIMPTQ